MEIWLLVIILLVIAIVLLVASLFVKDENDSQELLNDLLMQQSQELNALKQRIQELELMMPAIHQDQVTTTNFVSTENNSDEVNEEIDLTQIDEETRQTIITMYTQGFTMNEIKQEVGFDSLTIQSIVDDYIENR